MLSVYILSDLKVTDWPNRLFTIFFVETNRKTSVEGTIDIEGEMVTIPGKSKKSESENIRNTVY